MEKFSKIFEKMVKNIHLFFHNFSKEIHRNGAYRPPVFFYLINLKVGKLRHPIFSLFGDEWAQFWRNVSAKSHPDSLWLSAINWLIAGREKLSGRVENLKVMIHHSPLWRIRQLFRRFLLGLFTFKKSEKKVTEKREI